MKMTIELTKQELLRTLTLFEPLKDKIEFNACVEKLNKVVYDTHIIIDQLPTYDEYLEEYKKNSKLLKEMFSTQVEQLHKFEQWLEDNKDKTFTYKELEDKMLDLKLSYKGFNGGNEK